ncbi:hypothetical protein SOPP22_07360 [Shewanella sp. OPT22]|nr:hypothetical protein SOPP22_07360 [Shewanella sp. OPT22]
MAATATASEQGRQEFIDKFNSDSCGQGPNKIKLSSDEGEGSSELTVHVDDKRIGVRVVITDFFSGSPLMTTDESGTTDVMFWGDERLEAHPLEKMTLVRILVNEAGIRPEFTAFNLCSTSKPEQMALMKADMFNASKPRAQQVLLKLTPQQKEQLFINSSPKIAAEYIAEFEELPGSLEAKTQGVSRHFKMATKPVESPQPSMLQPTMLQPTKVSAKGTEMEMELISISSSAEPNSSRQSEVFTKCSAKNAAQVLFCLTSDESGTFLELFKLRADQDSVFSHLLAISSHPTTGKPGVDPVSFFKNMMETEPSVAKNVTKGLGQEEAYKVFVGLPAEETEPFLCECKADVRAEVCGQLYPDEPVFVFKMISYDPAKSAEQQAAAFEYLKAAFKRLPSLEQKIAFANAMNPADISKVMRSNDDLIPGVTDTELADFLQGLDPEVVRLVVASGNISAGQLKVMLKDEGIASELKSVLNDCNKALLLKAFEMIEVSSKLECFERLEPDVQLRLIEAELELKELTDEHLVLCASAQIVELEIVDKLSSANKAKLCAAWDTNGKEELAKENIVDFVNGYSEPNEVVEFLFALSDESIELHLEDIEWSQEVLEFFWGETGAHDASSLVAKLPQSTQIVLFNQGQEECSVGKMACIAKMEDATELVQALLEQDRGRWLGALPTMQPEFLFPMCVELGRRQILTPDEVLTCFKSLSAAEQAVGLVAVGQSHPDDARKLLKKLCTGTNEVARELLKKDAKDVSSVLYKLSAGDIVKVLTVADTDKLSDLVVAINPQEKVIEVSLLMLRDARFKNKSAFLQPESFKVLLPNMTDEQKLEVFVQVHSESPDMLIQYWSTMDKTEQVKLAPQCSPQVLVSLCQQSSPTVQSMGVVCNLIEGLHKAPKDRMQIVCEAMTCKQVEVLPKVLNSELVKAFFKEFIVHGNSEEVIKALNSNELLIPDFLADFESNELVEVTELLNKHHAGWYQNFILKLDDVRCLVNLPTELFIKTLMRSGEGVATARINNLDAKDLAKLVVRGDGEPGANLFALLHAPKKREVLIHMIDQNKAYGKLFESSTSEELSSVFKCFTLPDDTSHIIKLCVKIDRPGTATVALEAAGMLRVIEVISPLVSPQDRIYLRLAYMDKTQNYRKFSSQELMQELRVLSVEQGIDPSAEILNLMTQDLLVIVLQEYIDTPWCKSYVGGMQMELFTQMAGVFQVIDQGVAQKMVGCRTAGEVIPGLENTSPFEVVEETTGHPRVRAQVLISEGDLVGAQRVFAEAEREQQLLILADCEVEHKCLFLSAMSQQVRAELLIQLAINNSDDQQVLLDINSVLLKLDDDRLTAYVWSCNPGIQAASQMVFTDEEKFMTVSMLQFGEIKLSADVNPQQDVGVEQQILDLGFRDVQVPVGFKKHQIAGDGACFYRAVLASNGDVKDPSWLSSTVKPMAAVYDELVRTGGIQKIEEAVVVALSANEKHIDFISLMAAFQGQDFSIEGAAKHIVNCSIKPEDFTLFGPAGVNTLFRGQTFTPEDAKLRDELIDLLPDQIGMVLAEQFGMPTYRSQGAQSSYLDKTSNDHFVFVAPDGYFGDEEV